MWECARCTLSIRQKFFVDRVINVWNALPSTVNFASLNVLGTALKRLISLVFSFVIFYLCDKIICFITRFRAADSVLVEPCCPAFLNFLSMQMCILLYYWANKMIMMMKMWRKLKLATLEIRRLKAGLIEAVKTERVYGYNCEKIRLPDTKLRGHSWKLYKLRQF